MKINPNYELNAMTASTRVDPKIPRSKVIVGPQTHDGNNLHVV